MGRTIVIFFFFIVPVLYSQETTYEKIDYSKLEKLISDSTTSSYYSKLMDRYQKGDTTLSLNEYRCLYYGYTFQDHYHPWWTSKQIDILKPVYAKESFSNNDCDTIIKYAALSIKDFPFDLRQINMLGYAYHLKNNNDEARRWAYKTNGIIQAILSTGDGKTCESGFAVIVVAHEYELLKIFHLQSKEQTLTNHSHCDCLTIAELPEGKNHLYFDIWRTMEVLSNKLKK